MYLIFGLLFSQSQTALTMTLDDGNSSLHPSPLSLGSLLMCRNLSYEARSTRSNDKPPMQTLYLTLS